MDIKKILQDNETGFDEKLSSIMQMKLDPVCKSSNRISAILEKIEKVLIALADIQVRMKWQSTPRGRHSRSGSLITQSGFFAEKQFDAPTGDHEPHVRKDNTKS